MIVDMKNLKRKRERERERERAEKLGESQK